ncbi:efflux RND transporter periplasmic adaptor subunit [Myroides indicus]|uniref:Cobalt-zinc-cadmium efflux system membrane fusion protein n=1 Tax=Myroides indicus TaxID=1323422 RepID=A0A4R7EPF4_9FLAO|nr:efflux RND transporter periplasmic adaptor subunit [Myroides indicus]TDS53309.1 cobalt-zinc-cadmium efflux system membrane fusion protein [Myroides indicus]
MKKYIVILLSGSLFLTACKKQPDSSENSKNTTIGLTQNESSNKEVELSFAQYKAANIVLGNMEKKNLTEVVKVNGKTELPPQNQAEVNSFLSGTITQILVNLGDKVTKGQVIAAIDSPEFIRLQEEYQVSKSNLEYLQPEFERQQTLRSENVNSEKTFQKVKSDLNIEKSRYQSLSNQLKLLNAIPGQFSQSLKIISPITGNISAIPVKIGTSITPGQSLFSIVDNSQIHLDLMIYEKDLPYVHIGQKVSFNLTNINQTEITATIFSIGKSFIEGGKTVAAHAAIDNVSDNLIPGLYVNALIQTGQHEVDALPSDAIVKAEGREFIFITYAKSENNTVDQHFDFERIEIKSGVTELGYTEITLLQSLPKDYQIVLQGAYYIQSHLIKSEGGNDHNH